MDTFDAKILQDGLEWILLLGCDSPEFYLWQPILQDEKPTTVQKVDPQGKRAKAEQMARQNERLKRAAREILVSTRQCESVGLHPETPVAYEQLAENRSAASLVAIAHAKCESRSSVGAFVLLLQIFL